MDHSLNDSLTKGFMMPDIFYWAAEEWLCSEQALTAYLYCATWSLSVPSDLQHQWRVSLVSPNKKQLTVEAVERVTPPWQYTAVLLWCCCFYWCAVAAPTTTTLTALMTFLKTGFSWKSVHWSRLFEEETSGSLSDTHQTLPPYLYLSHHCCSITNKAKGWK